MKTNIKPLSILLTLLAVAFFFVILFPSFDSMAEDTFPSVYLYLSRIKADLDGSDGEEVEMILVFEVSQAFNEGGTIDIYFPPGAASADVGDWCRNDGNLDITAVDHDDIPPAIGTVAKLTEEEEESLTATCAVGTGGAGDSIQISNVGNLSLATLYGVKLENGSGASTGVLGTASTQEEKLVVIQLIEGANLGSGIVSLYILPEDTVEVVVEVEDAPSVACTLVTTQVEIPAIFPGGILRTSEETNQISTSSPSTGYYWAAYGQGDSTASTHAGLVHENNTYTIESTATTVNLLPGNSEGFGINVISDGDVPGDFQHGVVAGRFGGLQKGPQGARVILSNIAEVTGETATIIYGARASTDASTGSYSEEITYVCGGYY